MQPFSIHAITWLLEGTAATERMGGEVLTQNIGTEVSQDLPGSAGFLKLIVLAAGSGYCYNRNLVRAPLSSVIGKDIMILGDLQGVACCSSVVLPPELPSPCRDISDCQGGKCQALLSAAGADAACRALFRLVCVAAC